MPIFTLVLKNNIAKELPATATPLTPTENTATPIPNTNHAKNKKLTIYANS